MPRAVASSDCCRRPVEAGRCRGGGGQVQGTVDAESFGRGCPRRALEGGGRGHRQLECLLRVLAAGDHVGHAPGTGRGEQRVAGLLGGEHGTIGGRPGQERLAHAAQQRGRGVVDASADRASGRAGRAGGPGRRFHTADQAGQDTARRVVAGGLISLVRRARLRTQEVQADLPPRLFTAVHWAGSAVAHHGLLDQRRSGVGASAGLIPVRRAGELLDVHPQDLRQAHQDAVTVDAALASLDLGQPGLGPADQSGEHGLRQAAPSPGPRDPLPGGLAVGWRHPAPARTGSASMTSRHGGSLRSYGASGSNSTRTPMPRSVSRLAPNAGWLASWGLQCGTTTTGTP